MTKEENRQGVSGKRFRSVIRLRAGAINVSNIMKQNETEKALNHLGMEINRIADLCDDPQIKLLLNDLHIEIMQIKREQLPDDINGAVNDALEHYKRYEVPILETKAAIAATERLGSIMERVFAQ